MSEAQILDKIERKYSSRRKLLANGGDPARAMEIEGDIQQLYADLRLARARSHSGHPSEIVKRAQVERELERLMHTPK